MALATVVPFEVELLLAPTMTTWPAWATAAAKASKVPLLVKIAVTVGAAAKEETGEGATEDEETAAEDEAGVTDADHALELEGADHSLELATVLEAASLVLEGLTSVEEVEATSSTARA